MADIKNQKADVGNKESKRQRRAGVYSEQQREKTLMIVTPIVSVLLALIVGAIIIACMGKNPIEGYGAMISGALGDAGKLGKTLERACPLIFTSLAAVFAYKCGVFNLGGEGQFIMGACATATVILGLGLDGFPALLLGLLAGIVVGGIWALLPGIMKITRGLNEMITTIMLNYVALYFMEYIFKNVFSDQGLPKTLAMPKASHLVDVGTAHAGVIIAIALGVILWYVIFRTSFGFKIRAVGMSPTASKVNGFPVRLLDGVAIALIAQLNPIASIVVALLFGILSTGGTMMQSVIGVPTAIVDIIRGLIIIFAVAGMAMVKLPKVKAFIASLSNKNKKAEVTA